MSSLAHCSLNRLCWRVQEILFPDGAVRVVEPGGAEVAAQRGDLSAAVLQPQPSAESL